MLVEQLAYFTEGMVGKYTLAGSDDVPATPYMTLKRHIVKNGQHTNKQGKIELKLMAALVSVSHGKNVVSVDAYLVNITFPHQGRSSFKKSTHKNTRWVHVSSSSTDLRKFCVFKVQRFPFYLRNYLSFSTENKQNPSPVVNTEKSRVQSTPDQVGGDRDFGLSQTIQAS